MRYSIVLTGASSGIGSSLGNYLTKKGHKVIGLSRRINIKNKFQTLKCDITKFEQLEKILKKIKKVDCLINNAGIAQSGIKDDVKNFDKIVKTNLNGAYYLSYLLKKKLSKSKKSSIINIGSISGHEGSSLNPGYGASKTAILGLTRALANDYGPEKIRVNTITLGYIKTSMTIKSYNSKKEKKK